MFLALKAVNHDKKSKGNLFIMFWDFLLFEQIFLSPQFVLWLWLLVINWYIWISSRVAKQNYGLNKTQGLRKLEISGKPQKFIELLPSA